MFKTIGKLNRYDYLLFAIVILCMVFWLASKAHAEGTTAHVSWTWPTTADTKDPVTGASTLKPLALSAIQDGVLQWYVGSTLAGTKTVLAGTSPTAAVDIPNLICGNYDFVVAVRAKDGGISPQAPVPPAAYATGVGCTNPKPATGITVSSMDYWLSSPRFWV